jgi:hypothetical protein
MDPTALVGATAFDDVETALQALAVALAVIYIGWKGVKLVLGGVKKG